MALPHPRTRRWNVDEYRRLFESGILPYDERVELIEGEIVEMAPMNAPHRGAIIRSTRVLVFAFHGTHHVACQIPVEASEWSEPVPEFAIIPMARFNFDDQIKAAELVIGVSDTSLAYDRGVKASVYAKWGIPEYWILNVRHRLLEVHREPRPDATARFGFGWGSIVRMKDDARVTPLCRPDIVLPIEDLLVPKA